MVGSISSIENKLISRETRATVGVQTAPVSSPALTNPATPATLIATSASVVAINQQQAPLAVYSPAGVPPPVTPRNTAGFANADGSYTAGKEAVTINIKKSDSGYDNKIYYSTDNFATKHLVGIDNQTGSATITGLKEGTKIDFGIDNGHGDFFRTGGTSVNADGVDHVVATKGNDGVHVVGFEDLRGGGDRDYNDAIVSVRSVPSASLATALVATKQPPTDTKLPVAINSTPNTTARPGAVEIATPKASKPNAESNKVSAKVEAKKPPEVNKSEKEKSGVEAKQGLKTPEEANKPAVTKPASSVLTKPVLAAPAPAPAKSPVAANAAAPAKNNRSGLEDGTNPGQGNGRAHSPNTGTLNPSAVGKTITSTAPTAVVAKPVTQPTISIPAKPIVVVATSSPVAAKLDTTAPVAAIPSPVSVGKLVATESAKNRSGLGDGTNPGQGTGRINSPNTGTQNPSASESVTPTGKKTDDVKEAKVTLPTIDKQAQAAIDAYTIKVAKKFTTSLTV